VASGWNASARPRNSAQITENKRRSVVNALAMHRAGRAVTCGPRGCQTQRPGRWSTQTPGRWSTQTPGRWSYQPGYPCPRLVYWFEIGWQKGKKSKTAIAVENVPVQAYRERCTEQMVQCCVTGHQSARSHQGGKKTLRTQKPKKKNRILRPNVCKIGVPGFRRAFFDLISAAFSKLRREKLQQQQWIHQGAHNPTLDVVEAPATKTHVETMCHCR